MAEVTALKELVDAVPELRAAWEEHLRYYKEPLPHVFVGGDLARFAVQVAESSDADLVRRFSAAMEKLAASEHAGVVNLVHVSFVEFLAWGDEREQHALAALKTSFGPSILERIKEFEQWATRIEQSSAQHSDSIDS